MLVWVRDIFREFISIPKFIHTLLMTTALYGNYEFRFRKRRKYLSHSINQKLPSTTWVLRESEIRQSLQLFDILWSRSGAQKPPILAHRWESFDRSQMNGEQRYLWTKHARDAGLDAKRFFTDKALFNWYTLEKEANPQ